MSMPLGRKSNGEGTQKRPRNQPAATEPASEKRVRSKADSAVPRARRKVKQDVLTSEAASVEQLARAGAVAPDAQSVTSGAQQATAATPPVDDPFVISPEERHRLIAEAAYFRAQRRGFAGGEEQAQQDWLEAEAEIDRALSGVNRDQQRDDPKKSAR
jgi:hypothetical protein